MDVEPHTLSSLPVNLSCGAAPLIAVGPDGMPISLVSVVRVREQWHSNNGIKVHHSLCREYAASAVGQEKPSDDQGGQASW